MDLDESKPGEAQNADPPEGQDDPGSYFDLEALQAAADEVMDVIDEGDQPHQEEHNLEEEEPEAAPEKPEPEKPEPEDNAERSRLGRRLAKMEQTHQQQMTELTTLMQQQSILIAQLLHGAKPNEQHDDDLEDELLPSTRKEFEQYLAKTIERKTIERQTEQQQRDRKYQTMYLKTMEEIEGRETNPKLAAKVFEIMSAENSKFNLRQTGDPRVDARLNYAEAKADLIAKVVAAAKAKGNPIKGKPPKAPLGAGGSGGGSPPQNKTHPKLNPYASSAAKYFGLTPDEVSKVLGED